MSFERVPNRWSLLSNLTGVSLGLACAGVAALIVGAIYHHRALPYDWIDLAGAELFVPPIVTFLCCLGLPGRRQRAAVIAMVLFSSAGLAVMLLQNGWGEVVLDASPGSARDFNNRTYASDVLFCFGFSVQLVACALIALDGCVNTRARVGPK